MHDGFGVLTLVDSITLHYNIFKIMNILPAKVKSLPTRKISQMFRMMGQPTRLRIVLAIGLGEACVCHLETALEMRQAYISQHLMALRRAGLVRSRRAGRNIFYSLTHPELLAIIQQSGVAMGFMDSAINYVSNKSPLENCPCPHCTGEEVSIEHQP